MKQACFAVGFLCAPVASWAQACTVETGTVIERAVSCASEAYGWRHDEMVLALDRLTGGTLPKDYDTRVLLDSQALWEVYADATCTAEQAVFGGTLLGLKARYDCLGRLAAERRDVLLDMGDRIREARGLAPDR